MASEYDKYNDILRYLINVASRLRILDNDLLNLALSSSVLLNQTVNTSYLISLGATLYPILFSIMNDNRNEDIKIMVNNGVILGLLSTLNIDDLIARAVQVNNGEIINFLHSLD